MKCEHCGALLPPDARFCPVCGAKTIYEEEAAENAAEEMPHDEKTARDEIDSREAQAENTAEGSGEALADDPSEAEQDMKLESYFRLRRSLTEMLGSGAMLLVAVIGLLVQLLNIAQGSYSNIMSSATEQGFTISWRFAGSLLSIVAMVAILVCYVMAHGRYPRISIGALDTLRVLTIIRAVIIALGMAAFVCLTAFLMTIMAVGRLPVLASGRISLITIAALSLFLLLIMTLELIYCIKQAAFWKGVKRIWLNIMVRLSTGYLRFFVWMCAGINFIAALFNAAMIFSGDFIVSAVRSMGFLVDGRMEMTTVRLAPVLFGMGAVINLLTAVRLVAEANIYRQAAAAMNAYDHATGGKRSR